MTIYLIKYKINEQLLLTKSNKLCYNYKKKDLQWVLLLELGLF